MVGVYGIAARTFAAVESERLSVSTIFQASSESSIGFTLPESEADRAVTSIRRAFRDELARGLIDNVVAKPGMAVVAVVGDGMAGAPGIAARVFSALAAARINVVAIAQGSSERNISFALKSSTPPKRRGASTPRSSCRRSEAAGRRAHRRPMSCCSGSGASGARSPIRSRCRTARATYALSAFWIGRATYSSRTVCHAGG